MDIHPSFNPFRKIIIETLSALGWTCLKQHEVPCINYSIGVRNFNTLAGERTAIVWFNPWFECMGSLSGEYTTEGRNVLSTTRFSMDPDMTPQDVAAIATQFSIEALAIINNTTMIRAMKLPQRVGNHTTLTAPRVSNNTTLK